MIRHSALKTGLVGYVYRGLRDGGFVAIATGMWMFGATLYAALQSGRAEATVTAIEIACIFTRDLGNVEAVTNARPDCGNPALLQSGLVAEATFAKLSYASEGGAQYHSEIRVDDLPRPDVQRGETVEIAYSLDDPAKARAVPSFTGYLQGLGLIGIGVLMLMMVVLAKRAANYRGDVDAEVAELERAHRARTAKT